jgi:hypothetical protein
MKAMLNKMSVYPYKNKYEYSEKCLTIICCFLPAYKWINSEIFLAILGSSSKYKNRYPFKRTKGFNGYFH